MADSTPMLNLFLSDQMMITAIEKLWCAARAGGHMEQCVLHRPTTANLWNNLSCSYNLCFWLLCLVCERVEGSSPQREHVNDTSSSRLGPCCHHHHHLLLVPFAINTVTFLVLLLHPWQPQPHQWMDSASLKCSSSILQKLSSYRLDHNGGNITWVHLPPLQEKNLLLGWG